MIRPPRRGRALAARTGLDGPSVAVPSRPAAVDLPGGPRLDRPALEVAPGLDDLEIGPGQEMADLARQEEVHHVAAHVAGYAPGRVAVVDLRVEAERLRHGVERVVARGVLERDAAIGVLVVAGAPDE